MLRIATYNVENLDEDKLDRQGNVKRPTYAEREPVLRPALERLKADIIFFQEIHGQEREGEKRDVHTLRTLLAGTRYRDHQLVTTLTESGQEAYDVRNLVVALPPGWNVIQRRQINQDLMPAPMYQRTIAADDVPKKVLWNRPLLYVEVESPAGRRMHLINAHLKSKRPVESDDYIGSEFRWKSSSGWAEGFFMSSMKRVGAALEARLFIDQLLNTDPDAAIVLGGDLNALPEEVPVMAIRGRVEETGNPDLAGRVMVPLVQNVPEPARYTLFHRGSGELIDQILVSRTMLAAFHGTEIHNEILPDETIAFASDTKFPESDHAPVVATFDDSLIS